MTSKDTPNYLSLLLGLGLLLAVTLSCAQFKRLAQKGEGAPTPTPHSVEVSEIDEPPPPPPPAPARSAANSANIPKIVSGGVMNGKATSLPKPEYPAAARAVKASGQVMVEVTIDTSGNVTSATAVSGHPLLRAAAVQAARSAKFSPTLLSGQPVTVKGVLSFNFVP